MGTERLLSICIPTYNRADMLRATLESIVAARPFLDGKIDLFLSDNVSPDATPEVCAEFAARYPDRIRWRRLDEAIPGDLNFSRAMAEGTGKFLKLHTDKGPFAPGALERLVECLETCEPECAAVIPLPKLPGGGKGEIPVHTPDDVIRLCSFLITDINLCCVRRTAYETLEDPFRYWRRHFSQIDILFRLLNAGFAGKIIGGVFIPAFRVRYAASTRNNAECFGYHYISILQEQVLAGKMSRRTYQREKRKVLFDYIFPYHFDFFHQYMEPEKPLPFLRWMTLYRRDWFYYVALVWIVFYWFTSRVIPLHQMCGWCKRKLQEILQKRNSRGTR